MSFHPVQPTMLDKNHRIIVFHREKQEIARILRKDGKHHFQTRHMGEPGMQGLGVLGPLPPSASNDHAYDQRDIHPPAEHISPFRRLVYDLFDR